MSNRQPDRNLELAQRDIESAASMIEHYLTVALLASGAKVDGDTSAELNTIGEDMGNALAVIIERLERLEAQAPKAEQLGGAVFIVGDETFIGLTNEQEQGIIRLVSGMTRAHSAAEARIADLERALSIGENMRVAQKVYFTNRTQEALKAAKALESRFDKAAGILLAEAPSGPQNGAQAPLDL